MAYRETQAVRQHKTLQRAGLIMAAESLVRCDGFNGLTVQSLAREAGVAVGTVYRYFASKEELVCEVFRRASGREVEALASAMQLDGTPLERLSHVCRVFVERALKAPDLAWSLIVEPLDAALDKERLRYRASYAALFADLLAQGVASKSFPPQPVRLTAAAMVGGLAEALAGQLRVPTGRGDLAEELTDWSLRAAGAHTRGETR